MQELRPIGTCPHCKSIGTQTMVQYGRSTLDHPCHHDGWSELKCSHCGHRRGRWTGRALKGDFETGEHEPPHGHTHRFGCRHHVPTLRLVTS